jgi:hypothetical protein
MAAALEVDQSFSVLAAAISEGAVTPLLLLAAMAPASA